MAIIAENKKGKQVDPIEAGSYPARVYQLIHLGTIPGFQGKLQNKVRIGFELPSETYVFDETKGPQPRVISQDFTLSFGESANLRKVIVACKPVAIATVNEDGYMEEFDVEELIGTELLLTTAIKPKPDGSGNYAYIFGYTRLPKGMKCDPAVNPVQVLNFDNWNQELFDKLPTFLKDKISGSKEYKVMQGIETEENEEIPF